jgi:molybdopterin biosynthesis enzyme
MIKSAVIIPTGNEIRSGIVQDTDSAEVMRQLVKLNPEIEVTRISPVNDEEEIIRRTILKMAEKTELIILIGGSGGGHRFSPTLGKDFTHTALEDILPHSTSSQLFGKNGHLWCKLVCGKLENTLVINLPGPFTEAQAAMEAFCRSVQSEDLLSINKAMAQAVMAQYPTGAEIK